MPRVENYALSCPYSGVVLLSGISLQQRIRIEKCSVIPVGIYIICASDAQKTTVITSFVYQELFCYKNIRLMLFGQMEKSVQKKGAHCCSLSSSGRIVVIKPGNKCRHGNCPPAAFVIDVMHDPIEKCSKCSLSSNRSTQEDMRTLNVRETLAVWRNDEID